MGYCLGFTVVAVYGGITHIIFIFSRSNSDHRGCGTRSKQRNRAAEERAHTGGVDHQETKVQEPAGAHVLETTQTKDAECVEYVRYVKHKYCNINITV